MIKLENIDVDIECTCRLRPISRLSTAEEIELNHEEIRINVYLRHIANEIEEAIKSGKKLNMNYIDKALQ